MHHKPCLSNTIRLSRWITCLLLLLAPLSQAQENYGKSEDPVAAEALGVQIRTRNPDEMAYVINQVLMTRYVKEHKLGATDGEIEKFLARKKELDALSRKQAESRQAEINKALQSNTLPASERDQLQNELKFLDEMDKAANQSADDAETAKIEDQLARSFIVQWKVNQSLFRKYGGRVVYQQGGAEPLDAIHDFLKDAQKADDFTILNKAFEPALWSYYTTDSKHRFYPESGNEKEQAINTPWWMREPQRGP